MKPLRVTAADVAESAGVSKWTVIRAFDPNASISDETRDRVHRAAAKLGYQPNLLARSLAMRQTNQVAVLIDDFTNLHKLPLLEKLSLALQAEGKVLMLININRSFEQFEALIHAHQRQVDGVVLFANSLQDSIIEEAKAGRINTPLVIFARESTHEAVPSVTTSTKASMTEIGTYLIARGYNRPGFMTGPTAQASLVSRYIHFRDFWRWNASGGVQIFAAGSYDRKDADAAIRIHLGSCLPEERIDVLVCENDNLAIGAIDTIRTEFKLRVPEDVAVVGYDNIDMASSPAYGLTTYEQPLDAMIAAALDMLNGRAPRVSVEIPGRLVARSSA